MLWLDAKGGAADVPSPAASRIACPWRPLCWECGAGLVPSLSGRLPVDVASGDSGFCSRARSGRPLWPEGVWEEQLQEAGLAVGVGL